MMAKWIKRIWGLTVAGLLLQVLLTYNRLPERMASHFDAAGKPNGWTLRSDFLTIWFVAIVAVNIWPLITDVVLQKLPPSLINLPHKDYWLSDPKRARCAAGIVSAILAGVLGGANLILLLAYQYTYDYNLYGSSPWNIWFGLVLEGIITVVVIVWGFRRLYKPDGLTPS